MRGQDQGQALLLLFNKSPTVILITEGILTRKKALGTLFDCMNKMKFGKN